jgi:hypothetical protein
VKIHDRLPAAWNIPSQKPPVILPPPLYNTLKTLPTIIHHLASLTSPHSECTLPFHTPPWLCRHPWGDRLISTPTPPSSSKTKLDKYCRSLKARLSSYSRNPFILSIYTDGSRHHARGHRRTGAGYAAYSQGAEVRAGRRGLGRRADNFDAEMFALAGAAAAAENWHQAHTQTKLIIFLTDNQSAIRSITDTSDHPAQLASVIFQKRIDAVRI